MMTPEEYEWRINILRGRYQYLQLTPEQAKAVVDYEQDKDTQSDHHYFSVWEEWDYEWTLFRQILQEEQFRSYEAVHKKSKEDYEHSLIEQDKEKTNEVPYHEDLLSFYEKNLLPDFFRDMHLRFGWLTADRPKIDYLKSEYRRFLYDTKKAILVSHFRHSRTFKPNDLKVSLLRHKLSYVLPDYHSFKHWMDEPTKAVARYLEAKVRYLPRGTEELLTRKFKELSAFVDANIQKHHGDMRGWHVVLGHQTPEEQKENQTMVLLLLDEEKYGA